MRQENRTGKCNLCAADDCNLPYVNNAPNCKYYVRDVGVTGEWLVKQNVTNLKDIKEEPDRPLPERVKK